MEVETAVIPQKSSKSIQLDFDQILQILPQKPPFVMVDQVVELVEGKHIVAVKNFSLNELSLFYVLNNCPKPYNFILETLISECIGQTGIIFFKASTQRLKADIQILLTRVEATFNKRCSVNEQVRVKIEPLKMMRDVCILYARGFANSKVIVEGEMSLFVKTSST